MNFKYIALVLGAMLLVVFSSCTKEESDGNGNGGTEQPQPNNGGNSGNTDAVPEQMGFREDGASIALFSVSENKQVRFSRGNLQYKASTNTWRFAEHQYNFVGEANNNISSTYEGWIDLFGWGTSGWAESGAVCYQPWSTSTSNSDYNPGNDYENNLTGAYADADWAWHNAIQNGGNSKHLWRTLTIYEWQYLLETRPNAAEKYGAAKVGNTKGLMVLPDIWTLPEGLSFTPGYSEGHPFTEYTLTEWQQLEAAGALFLPASGVRIQGTNYMWANKCGYYWSTNNNAPTTPLSYSRSMYFNEFEIHPAGYDCNRHHGYAVRPVMENN